MINRVDINLIDIVFNVASSPSAPCREYAIMAPYITTNSALVAARAVTSDEGPDERAKRSNIKPKLAIIKSFTTTTIRIGSRS